MTSRRSFLAALAAGAGGLVVGDQALELFERLTHSRRFFPSALDFAWHPVEHSCGGRALYTHYAHRVERVIGAEFRWGDGVRARGYEVPEIQMVCNDSLQLTWTPHAGSDLPTHVRLLHA